MARSPRRWPGWVYDAGEEPDYRFSFANERTFLAWIRTALALVAGGVALDVVDLSTSDTVQHALGLLLVLLGAASAVLAWVRWAMAERSMRSGQPLPSFGIGATFTLGVLGACAVLIVVLD